jgi:ankyrin repeat protein
VPGETEGTYYTPLLAAAWKGHTETARALVDAGAKKPSRDELHKALREAVGSEKYPPDTVPALLVAGGGTDPDINKKDSVPSWQSVCKRGYCASFSPSHGYLWGCTMLHFAAEGGNAGAVKALIEARADVNSTCYYGQTALELASQGGKLEVVKTLIAAGASVNHRDSDGNEDSALDYAVSGGYLETVQALLAAKADLKTCTNRPTPLMKAARLRNLELVRALLSAGADVNSTCAGTALSTAAGEGNLEMVRFLLSQGAKVNTVITSASSSDETALASAALEGHLDVVQVLLAAKADVNAAHGAALYHAVELRQNDVARALLDAGANPSLRYPNGGSSPTPLSVSQNKEIAELLRQHGARE